MEEKKCPACGALIQAEMESCPACGLEGLQFLAGYEKWVREVLEPHRRSLHCQVFAGVGYGLILTPRGDLYGIGENRCGQIEELGNDDYRTPCLMAKEVISAAAGRAYTAYVTRDGEVHLRGKGDLVDAFRGFSGARKVYGDNSDRFWIKDREGRLFVFGNNRSVAEKPRTWKELEPVSYEEQQREGFVRFASGGYPESAYVPEYSTDPFRIKREIMESESYREAVRIYGEANVSLELKEISRVALGTTAHPSGRPNVRWKVTCLPEIRVSDEVLYEPVSCPDWDRVQETGGWCGSEPFSLPKTGLPGDVKKGVTDHNNWLFLSGSGNLEISGGQRLGGLTEPVEDLAMSANFVLLICGNGEILWNKRTEWYSLDWWEKIRDGKMNRCHLPE